MEVIIAIFVVLGVLMACVTAVFAGAALAAWRRKRD